MHADVLLCLFDLRSDLAGRGCALCLLSCFTCQPNGFSNIIISQLIVDSIRGQYYEVVNLGYLKGSNVRQCLDHIWIATTVLQLGFWVTKSSTDGEAAG